MCIIEWLCKVGSDKYVHLICSLLITFAAGKVICLVSPLGGLVSALIGAGVGFAIGVAKEAVDKRFDWQDILADSIGCLLGFIVTAL